jgi:O-antigen biosynthesis protein
MARSSRRHSQNNSTPQKNAVYRDPQSLLVNSSPADEVDTLYQLDSIGSGVVTSPAVGLDPDDVIIENTDDKIPPQPGDGLITSRKNRMIASLGDRAELVSIVVQAYNRLEKTKICIECILKYTSDIEYELVLVDNGSTDGTLDYFKSVKHPRKKIIRVTRNVGSYVTIVNNALSGRYIATVCNDTYVTQNWLTNLLTCLKSEDAIGMVVPVISNGSNMQGANIAFKSLDEMQEKAAKHNLSNPGLWHERLRLVIQMAIYKREAMEMAGLVDYGFFHDFADDDLTFRIRRAGYKTVLCKDTYVHHDHVRANLSEKEREEFNHSIKAGKNDFQKKYFGIDAWDDVNNYETELMSLIDPLECKGDGETQILGVDVLCGTPILELKNRLRLAQITDVRLSAFSTDPKYWLDLKTICAGEVVVDRIEMMTAHFKDERFDFVVLGNPINAYPKPLDLLRDLLHYLKRDGRLLIKLRNTNDAIFFLGALGIDIQVDAVYPLSMKELIDAVKAAGFTCKKTAFENWPLDEKLQRLLKNAITAAGFANKLDEILSRAAVRSYFIDISRG